ncbi:hypothetical protein PENTCL1PPCAC_18626 [Pristionchus entomophagus]|uniref:Uncharacterized protein n=1 Tax=Pristionchus entomophagus TaxID=358040 RepID=A0AAV5TQ12_9BILA|nr:hypothetical protein PENTCL1PPCAC_18626 [Pristionchus entomophagus]
MYKLVFLAALIAVTLAGDSHAKRQVLLPAYGTYPGFAGGLAVPAYPSFGFSSFPYVTYHVSAPTVVAPAVATATVITTTLAPVAVPTDTIKVAAYPIAPIAPPPIVAPVEQKKGSTKISVIQKDD